MKIITAFTNKSFGIGKAGAMPWYIPEDLSRFANITKGNTVVMGRNTWESFNKIPLRDRFNVVVTSECAKYSKYDVSNLMFIDSKSLDSLHEIVDSGEIYIIGGEDIYRKYVGEAEYIYATVIEQDIECDRFFPLENFHKYEIESASPSMYSPKGNCNFRYITYKKKNTVHDEFQYLKMMEGILYNGEARPDRTGVGTLSTFAHQLRFDISKSVPFLTTKQLAWKTVLKELLWFISGSTDSKILENQSVNIWKGNTSREFLDKRGLEHYKEGDTGPLYSHALRAFGSVYTGCNTDYTGKGFDQFNMILQSLRTDPYSRRHVMTTFNPSIVDQCVLMPCHGIAIQFYVSGDLTKQHLSCHVYCRSSDSFLGLPFNIASYAALTYLVAKLVNMNPGELIISTGDTHIYANHVDQVKAQLSRNPLPFPKLKINDHILSKSLSEINLDDFQLDGYISYGAIRAPMAV